ncbi:hypothetical protein B0H17DRAFT_1210442 [Mycena rosella]|uniref:Uncharacterized protein n=1 Tax=Mycena rosella TaxID=1033263 RepID=A0AAD7G8G6_MYCRO|nr:hypothetical protein B0H17DRAFT_1210442 [Mycena rosella]
MAAKGSWNSPIYISDDDDEMSVAGQLTYDYTPTPPNASPYPQPAPAPYPHRKHEDAFPSYPGPNRLPAHLETKKARKRRRRLEREEAAQARAHPPPAPPAPFLPGLHPFLPLMPTLNWPPAPLPLFTPFPYMLPPKPLFYDAGYGGTQGGGFAPPRDDVYPPAQGYAAPRDEMYPPPAAAADRYEGRAEPEPSAWVSSMAADQGLDFWDTYPAAPVDPPPPPPVPAPPPAPSMSILRPPSIPRPPPSLPRPPPPPPAAPAAPAAKPKKPASRIIGMAPDQDRHSKHGTFLASPATLAGPTPYIPNPARTLVMEQLPKPHRTRAFVAAWGRAASGAPPVYLAVDPPSGKALVEFATAELARRAWGSGKLGEGGLPTSVPAVPADPGGPNNGDLPANGSNVPKPKPVKGRPRADLVRVWWFRVPGVGAGAGVGEIEEGEIEGDGEAGEAGEPAEPPSAPPLAAERDGARVDGAPENAEGRKESKKERKARLARGREAKSAKAGPPAPVDPPAWPGAWGAGAGTCGARRGRRTRPRTERRNAAAMAGANADGPAPASGPGAPGVAWGGPAWRAYEDANANAHAHADLNSISNSNAILPSTPAPTPAPCPPAPAPVAARPPLPPQAALGGAWGQQYPQQQQQQQQQQRYPSRARDAERGLRAAGRSLGSGRSGARGWSCGSGRSGAAGGRWSRRSRWRWMWMWEMQVDVGRGRGRGDGGARERCARFRFPRTRRSPIPDAIPITLPSIITCTNTARTIIRRRPRNGNRRNGNGNGTGIGPAPPPLEPRAMKNARSAARRDLEARVARGRRELAEAEAGAAGSSTTVTAATASALPANGAHGANGAEGANGGEKEGKAKEEKAKANEAGSASGPAAMEDNLRRLVLRSQSQRGRGRGVATPVVRAASPVFASASAGAAAAVSLDELAVSFITETIQTLAAPSGGGGANSTSTTATATTAIANGSASSADSPTPTPTPTLTLKQTLAAKQQRLEAHIAESRALMAQLAGARGGERARILGVMRERGRMMEEESTTTTTGTTSTQQTTTLTSTSMTMAAGTSTTSVEKTTNGIGERRLRWPESRNDVCVLIISDDEDEEGSGSEGEGEGKGAAGYDVVDAYEMRCRHTTAKAAVHMVYKSEDVISTPALYMWMARGAYGVQGGCFVDVRDVYSPEDTVYKVGSCSADAISPTVCIVPKMQFRRPHRQHATATPAVHMAYHQTRIPSPITKRRANPGHPGRI